MVWTGLIVSNTTLSREGLKDTPGQRSRRPFRKAALREIDGSGSPGCASGWDRHLPIIGVGGVCSAETAAEKIRAGADLVQLYSCMVL
ncbi:hypothetical protein F2981_08680 [Sinorhizobium meliloti]|nr:hypothetical protein [Sinorhizobium meliloti]